MDKQRRVARFFTAVSQRFPRVFSEMGLSGLPFQIRIILVFGFIFSLGRNIAFPYLAMFMTGKNLQGGLQFDPSLVGLMIMIGGLAYTFALLVTGNLCDRFGRKRMMVGSMILQALLVRSINRN